jgi:BirA family biotin operon repressor/biotin-[acetyl-CoA-carboxylase] ligase
MHPGQIPPNGSSPVPLVWDPQALAEHLRPILPGIRVEVLPQAASTNSLLLDRLRAASGSQECLPPEPSLLVAEQQTGGRGRLGRTWHATPGASLTFSLALPMAPAGWSGLSLAVGVALADAIDPPGLGPPRVGLKWPNDLWLISGLDEGSSLCQDQPEQSGRKLGGILVETMALGASRWVVVGVGLNVRPLDLDEADGLRPACWSEVEPCISVPQALARVVVPLAQALQSFERFGFESFTKRYAVRDVLLGRAVTLTQAEVAEGVALGVAPDGALKVGCVGGTRLVTSGEVSVRLKSISGPGARVSWEGSV